MVYNEIGQCVSRTVWKCRAPKTRYSTIQRCLHLMTFPREWNHPTTVIVYHHGKTDVVIHGQPWLFSLPSWYSMPRHWDWEWNSVQKRERRYQHISTYRQTVHTLFKHPTSSTRPKPPTPNVSMMLKSTSFRLQKKAFSASYLHFLKWKKGNFLEVWME